MRYPGRSSCDTTPSELGVIDLVTQHNQAAHQEFSGHRRFGFGFIATLEQSLVRTFQVSVLAASRLTSLAQEKAQQARAGLADAAHAMRLGRGAFNRVESDVTRHFPRAAKATDRPQGVPQAQGREDLIT
jgi:hypothetical protein